MNDGIKATINGALHGSIDTLLDSSGNFTPTLRHAYSIAGLTIDGTMDDNIQAGGNISGVKFLVPKTGAQPLDLTGSILAGDGGPGSLSASGPGGAGGAVSSAVVKTIGYLSRGVGIYGGHGGHASGAGVGGAGGAVSKSSITAIDYVAGGVGISGGGGGTGGSSGANGGAGGMVSSSSVTVASVNVFIYSGDGGSATTSAGGGSPGVGGSITGVKITGDIGDFQSDFDVDGADSGMGGLVAGLGGHHASGAYSIAENGSITKGSATRITAILAGENAGTSLDAYKAVASITGLKTSFIGADLNGDRTFDWESGSAPETGTGFAVPPSGANSDTPFDGLVIVAMGGFAQSATIPILPGALLFE